jgi:hypothetical protein
MDEALISRNEDLEAVLFCNLQQFTVLEGGPAHVGSGADLVRTECGEVGS